MEHNDSDFIISENRIDIIIGVEYVKAYIGKLKTNFFEKLYISNKRSFNGLREKDWNHGWENPTQKRGKFAFIESFDRLIDSIKESGTNSEPIPLYLGDKNELWVSDGMHRAAACYGLGLPVNVEIHNEPIEKHSRWYYPTDIEFFRKGHKGRGMRGVYCDYTMEMFFRKYIKDFRCIVFWPNTAEQKMTEEMEQLYKDDLLYEHTINLVDINKEKIFEKNITRLLYENHGFLNKRRFNEKVRGCFCGGKQIKILFLKDKNEDEITTLKYAIRDCFDAHAYGQDNYHALHATDTLSEAKYRVLQLLNNNTLNFLGKVSIKSDYKRSFHKKFNKFRKFCDENKIDKTKICIVGKFIESIHTKSDCGQIEIIADKTIIDRFSGSPYNVYNNELKSDDDKVYTNDDIIYNPNNHFYYFDYKCCLPELNGVSK